MTMVREDPKARERSLMFKKHTICDGQRDGFQCKFYWRTVDRIDVANPDEVRNGKTQRFCILLGNPPFSMSERGAEMSHDCNQYVASERPYVPEAVENNPMTTAEVLALRAVAPSDPLDPTAPGNNLPDPIVEVTHPNEDEG